MKWFLSALLLVSGFLVARGVNADVLYQSAPVSGVSQNTSPTNSLANKITLSNSARITSLVISASGPLSPSSPLNVSLCQDLSGQPGNCVSLTLQGSGPPFGSNGPVTYIYNSGFQVIANQPFWVTFTSSPDSYSIAMSTGGLGYFSSGGLYTHAPGLNELFITIYSYVPPSPSSVPSLSEWTQLLLGLMVMMLIGWHFHRERSY